MSARDAAIDLDFTKGAPAPAEAAAQPALRPDTEIGCRKPGTRGNFIAYARYDATRSPAAAQAPVLVVEDDEDTRRLLERILAREGYLVRTAADSAEFLQAIRKPPLPRLILLDVELPRISGFKILALLRQHPQTSVIPVVMVTARSENKDVLHAMSLGADGYLSKPVTLEMLRATIEKVLPRTA